MTTRDPEPADLARLLLEELSQFATVQFEVGRAFARAHGLHPTDAAAVLEIIAAEERGQPLTPARLAERVGLTSGATSILVGRLVDAGHISRSKEASDKRLVALRATDAVHRSADALSDARRRSFAAQHRSPAPSSAPSRTTERRHGRQTIVNRTPSPRCLLGR